MEVIIINDKPFDWFDNMTVYNMLKAMGYTLKKPAVLIKVNDQLVRKSVWDNFLIPENAEITVVNLLRGG